MNQGKTRTERDSMGEMQVPAEAYYGASTQRARINFPISDLRIPGRMIRALGLIKWAAAGTNGELGLVPARLAGAVARAAEEVAEQLNGTLAEGSPVIPVDSVSGEGIELGD